MANPNDAVMVSGQTLTCLYTIVYLHINAHIHMLASKELSFVECKRRPDRSYVFNRECEKLLWVRAEGAFISRQSSLGMASVLGIFLWRINGL